MQADEVPKIMVHTNISCPLNPEKRWNDLCRNMQITCSGSRIIKVMIVATLRWKKKKLELLFLH